MDDLAESVVPDAESDQVWFPRWVLAGYGVALGAAGALTAYQTELLPQIRAGGVSAFVLGGGCVVLAVQQGRRGRRFADGPFEEPTLAEPEILDPEAQLAAAELAARELVVIELAIAELASGDLDVAEFQPDEPPAEAEAAAIDEASEYEEIDEPVASSEPESDALIPPQSTPEDLEPEEIADFVRLERLEAQLADDRARVDRVTAEVAALRRLIVEQRQRSNSKS